MSDNFMAVSVSVGAVPRGNGTQVPATFRAQAMVASFAWGSQPGEATITYVPVAGVLPFQSGSDVRLKMGAHYFAGICQSDTETKGSGGKLRTLQFIDYRTYLQWDYVFCAFNKPDVKLVNGVRVKRYKHMYPFDYTAWAWSYTFSPLVGWQIVDLLLGAPTIGTPWSVDYTGFGLFSTGVLGVPVYDVDCLGGRRLDAALNEVNEKAGTVLTISSTAEVPYKLVWTRKGYGDLPVFPGKLEDKRQGTALSGHATNVCVLGSRNLYQVLDMPMAKDWAAGWEQFVVFESFAEDIYQRDKDPLTGVAFKSTPSDPEQYIGRQKANARALEITVREYVALRGSPGAGDAFSDTRKFAGRSRLDMPCALYIQTLLYRAFRPDLASFTNAAGRVVPLTVIDIADQLLCRVSHDASTGDMTAYPAEPVDGNGYAVVKGYQVGADLFRSIKSDQWNVNFFKDATRAWAAASFQIDDSGEGVRFIIFNAPVIVSSDLLLSVNGNVAINAKFTVTVPAVRAALVLEVEPFQYWFGTYPSVSRDIVENVSGLNAEYVVKNGDLSEIVYANGMTAASKASEIANGILLRQYLYLEGGVKHIWTSAIAPETFGTQLGSLIDRVQVHNSPQGVFELVDYTNERQRDHFEPERELDRRTMQNALLPGQAELRQRAQDARNLASAFRQMPQVGKLLSALLTGNLGQESPLQLVWLAGPPANARLAVGTPIRKKPTSSGANTVGTYPTNVGAGDTVFMGLTVRDQEDATKPFYVQSTGPALARVQGPVNENDTVGLTGTNDTWLIKDGTPSVGKALQAIGGSTLQVIQVALGSGGGASGGVLPIWL